MSIMPFTCFSQLNAETLSSPFLDSSEASEALSRTVCIFSAISSGLCGSNVSAAPSAISASEEQFEQTHGIPQAIAKPGQSITPLVT